MNPPVETRRFHPYSRDYAGVPADQYRKREIFGDGYGRCSFSKDGKSPVVVLNRKVGTKECVLEEDEGTSVKWTFPAKGTDQARLYGLIGGEDTVRVLVRRETELWEDRGEYYVTGLDMVYHPDPVDTKGRMKENRRFVLKKKDEFVWDYPGTETEEAVFSAMTSPFCL